MTDGICVAAAGVVDLWYASQKRGPSQIAVQDYEHVKSVLRDPDRNFHVLALSLETVPHIETSLKAALPDPFDRMIVASALEHDLPLVTADKRITELGVAQIVW